MMNKITKSVLLIAVATLILGGSYSVYKKQGGSEEQMIIIGAVLPLSGDYAPYAEGSRNAAIMAIEDSGMQDRVKFIVEDDKGCMPVGGVSAAQKLINIDKVNALYGPMCSSEALSVAPLTEPVKIPMVIAAATSKTLSGAGNYIFRTIASDSVRSYAVAKYAYEKGFKKAAFMFDNSQDALVQEKNDAKEAFVSAGGEAVLEDSFGGKDMDFKTQLSKIKASGADVVFIGASYKQVALMVKQAREMKISVQFVSTDESVDIKEFFVTGGSYVEGVIAPAMVKPSTEESKTFAARYKARFGVDATIYTAEGYDAMMLLLKAIKEEGMSGDEIKAGLLKVGNNYPGASGIITFNEKGDVTKPAVVKVAKNGVFEEIK
ncbi:MAG: Extracellular ligand-binding receptor [Candidatus Wolfebacteria bacterium GW2011_GWC2_46_275]|uniref:Extracellular ligand-binding receptor n=2 Tax=Candidatus Wolfeibacteriota TaxID=1752735 RepID=A0A0G1U8H5_9BACT|nr:MAG: ABC transporter substrate-binding protein, branched-chain amino acid transport system substrate-binding protein [Candidatus Wolfebacteria bacterium GW2011_GWB1_47_1]KKU36377.1 MAG: Extracellular ligand-binding receptor [Candidatus Wolfebacteria bacterium GW2011_GWC2_46_275]KKU42052.1 MAG: Extracellular ligand-binding receptor [Candidatus Wolfebacteria bacterium GW2011_GWB2_46_69]KKU54411.1 MAG: Extracellular ligand-binding receptor [Candidatus Wolfebacteria bacterium GW2011_GWC1_47_103]